MNVIEGQQAPPVYDSKNTLQVLNMAVVAVKMIASSADRIVLQQQYDTIIKNLNICNIKDDNELLKLHEDLLESITNLQLKDREKKRFKDLYERDQKRRILGAFGEVVSALSMPGELPWLAIGHVFMRGASAFFGYRTAKKRLSDDLKDNLWHLEREETLAIANLQRRLFKTAWKLSSKYHFSPEELVSQDDLDELECVLQETDAEEARSMFADLEGQFKEYPPFWFYWGEAAFQCRNFSEAKRCFECFEQKNHNVLKKDPYKAQIAKYRLMMGGTERDVREQLEILAKDKSVWQNNLFRGLVLFSIGDKEAAKEAVRRNIKFKHGKDISQAVLDAMEHGIQRLWGSLARVFYDGKGEEFDLVAAYKYACLATLFEDDSVKELKEKIEGSRFLDCVIGKKPQISQAIIDSAQAEAQRLYERMKGGILPPPPPPLPTPQPPDTLRFGHYPQDANGEVQPIEWRVLAEKHDRRLLVSEYALDARAYHNERADIAWENCSLRAWLNGAFLNEAFTDDERAQIVPATNYNLSIGGAPGPRTTDRVFLLSVEEADQYFAGDEERQCRPTEFAQSRVGDDCDYIDEDNGCCWWWLRTPGRDSASAARVNFDGKIVDVGIVVNNPENFVRPAMWVAKTAANGD